MPEAPPRVRVRFRDVFARDPASQYVSPEAIQKQTEELITTDPELSVDRDLRDGVVAGVLERRDTILDACGDELTSLASILPIPKDVYFYIIIGISGVLPITLTIFTGFGEVAAPGVSRETLLGMLTAGSFTCLAVGAGLFTLRKSRLRVALARFREEVRNQLRALIRQVSAELADSKIRWANTFDATEAPALVNMDLQDAVSSAGYARVRDFVRSHSASAIGIAGSRGAGKSTLMQQLRSDPTFRCIGIRVAAPVYYGAADFIRLIHWELAAEALTWARRNPGNGSARGPAPAFPLDIRRPLRWLALLAVTLVLVIAWIYDREDMQHVEDLGSYAREGLAGFRIGALGLVALVGLSAVAGYLGRVAWHTFQSGARLTAPRPTVAGIAAQQLEFLRWSATVEKSAKTSLKADPLGFEGQNKYTRTERERSHANSVRELREFIATLIALAPDDVAILVCVDELDKIADPQQAVETVNGIKDLFHIPGAHFLVSVSSDALSNFHARGVPLRDVFDSSFDTMIRMEPLSYEECRDLISRRARGFPSSAVMFCYAWSGGNARDLIRTARACVDYRRGGQQDASLTAVVTHVLRADLDEVLDAAIEKLRGDHEAELEYVVGFRERVQRPNTPLSDALATALQQTPLPVAPQRASEAQLLAAALDPYSRIAGLTTVLFATPRTPEEWQLPGVRTAVDTLAAARAALGRHPSDLRRLVNRAVEHCADAIGRDEPYRFLMPERPNPTPHPARPGDGQAARGNGSPVARTPD